MVSSMRSPRRRCRRAAAKSDPWPEEATKAHEATRACRLRRVGGTTCTACWQGTRTWLPSTAKAMTELVSLRLVPGGNCRPKGLREPQVPNALIWPCHRKLSPRRARQLELSTVASVAMVAVVASRHCGPWHWRLPRHRSCTKPSRGVCCTTAARSRPLQGPWMSGRHCAKHCAWGRQSRGDCRTGHLRQGQRRGQSQGQWSHAETLPREHVGHVDTGHPEPSLLRQPRRHSSLMKRWSSKPARSCKAAMHSNDVITVKPETYQRIMTIAA